ncbi:MAG: rhomboid family intramembrane serine protease [Odoribacter sp.]|nr:rhomboid family intramembrane serine protease [Odoribacter sp.]
MYYGRTGSNFSGSMWGGIKNSYRKGSALVRLIYINIGLFLLIKILGVLLILSGYSNSSSQFFLEILGLPAYWQSALYHPWMIITYMFTHFGFFHLLFNMLWLYWFGSMFLNHFNNKQLTTVYILGGISGALLYLLSYNYIPFFAISRYHSIAIGASASVMAIVFAVCFYIPQHRIYIFLIGPVKLINLAIFTAIIDIVSIPSDNAGGHIAHLGGALFGIVFVNVLRKGSSVFKKTPKKKMKVKYKNSSSRASDYEYNAKEKGKNDRINEILDKISRSGYESLTREEKEILFKSGRD